MTVKANVTSEFVITSVSANIGGVTVPMTNTSGTSWQGSVDISGLGLGPVTLTVTATDAGGGITTLTRELKHDKSPQLTVLTLADSVARTDLRLQATCADSDPYPCATVEAVGLASTTSASLDQTVSLAGSDGKSIVVKFVATDTAGLTSSLEIPIHVESSPRLQLEFEAGARVLDIDSTRILYVDENSVKVRNRITNVVSVLGSGSPLDGHLFSNGAMWGTSGRSRGATVGGTLSPCCGASCTTNGDWATTVSQPASNVIATREYLPTGAVETATTAGSLFGGINVDANGNASYDVYESGFAIRVWPVNGTSTVSSASNGVRSVIDGSAILWQGHTLSGARYGIKRTVGTETILLDSTYDAAQPQPRPFLDYRANDGWAAYTKVVGGALTAWTRAPNGTMALAAPQSGVSGVECVNASGEIVYDVARATRYVGAAGTPVRSTAIGGAHGQLRYLPDEGSWYELLGRDVFRVDLDDAGSGGTADAGGGTSDAGSLDSGMNDAAVEAGAAGESDGGAHGDGDGTTPDGAASGAESGGSTTDAAVEPLVDAGPTPSEENDEGCSSAGTGAAPSGSALLAAIGGLLVSNRRRRGRAENRSAR